MYKTVAEVAAALNQAPNQAIVYENYDGKKYISWDDSVRELNRIFGPFGWSTRAVSQSGHPAEGVYLAAIEVSVTVTDEETDEHITVTRAGFGRAVAQPTQSERNDGLTVSTNLITHDTAASAAGSDALSKATKLLGAAFGLDFYGEAKRARANGQQPQAPRAQGGTQRPPSAAQMRFLASLGYEDADVAGMDFATWKAVLDNKTRKPGTVAKPRGAAVEQTSDAIPF